MIKGVKYCFLALIFISFSNSLFAQTFSSEKKRREVEMILNTALNNKYFDRACDCKEAVFEANELLSIDSPLMLYRKGEKVIILDASKIDSKKTYVVLGDFTTDLDNPTGARVQIVVMPEETFLNLYLTKEGGKWKIKNHAIVQKGE